MKTKKIKLLALIVVTALILALVSATAFTAPAPADYGTQRDYVLALIRATGLNSRVIGTSNADRDALAKGLGFFDKWDYNPTAMVNDDNKASIDAAMADAYNGLYQALRKVPMEPYFVHGMAQPIFPYGSGTSANAAFDNTGEGVVRFVVYVETDYDTDNDGKLDLMQVYVQLPRAAVTQGMKCATIYHGQPYNAGTNDDSYPFPTALQTEGQTWLNANGVYDHELLHRTAPPRVPMGEYTTAEMVARANPGTQWRYQYSYSASPNFRATMNWGASNSNQISSTTINDYFLVRGFASVSAAGLGTACSEGVGTNFADVEIAAFAKVVAWLHGDAKAYSDRTSNIEVKADWSNGLVGMTGTSYGGTVPMGVATTGVEGLKTIIPVAAIMSGYEYVNQQGVSNMSSPGYTSYLLYYVISRMGTADWAAGQPWRGMQLGYLKQMLNESTALGGNYDDHWQRRDYSYDGWFKDWGPSKMKASMLIVHGLNDNNVRPKQSVLMHQNAVKHGIESRMIWDQGHHMTPNGHMIGNYAYQEWENMWFSHYLYEVDNNVLDMLPPVYAQDNLTGDYLPYDSFESASNIVLDNKNRVLPSTMSSSDTSNYEVPVESTVDFFRMTDEEKEYYSELYGNLQPAAGFAAAAVDTAPLAAPLAAAEESYTIINSANGSSSWQNQLNLPTAGSTLYSFILPEDITIKGVIQVNLRAAVETLGSNLGGATARHSIHARLAEVAATGRTVSAFGTNVVGATIGTSTIVSGGLYQGGGLTSGNIVRFNRATTLTYREIARGWMDLGNPYSGYVSYTSHIKDRINLRNNIGVFHDYTLYLQPAIHNAKAGNRLALIISFGNDSTTSYTGNNAFSVRIDNEASNIFIPVELAKPDPVTITPGSAHVAPGDIVDITYSIKDNSHGFSSFDLDLPFISSAYTPVTVTPSALLSGGTFDYSISGNVLNVTFNSPAYTVGDGALFTVTYKVNEAAYAFSAPLNVKVNALQYGNFLDELLDLDAIVKPGALSTYTYRVVLKPSKPTMVRGDTLSVDVMLEGGLSYSQAAMEIAYDPNLLAYDGYTSLQGWAASVTKPAANIVAVRSVPSMNMLTGAPTSPAVKIVTLQFKVGDGFDVSSVNTDLFFASALISPTGGVTGVTLVPGLPATITLLDPLKIHYGTIVIDTHNDSMSRVINGTTWLPQNDPGPGISNAQLDLPKMRAGGLDVAFCGAYTNAYAADWTNKVGDRANSRILSLLNALYWASSSL
jgi:X-Pro dipeptidyl-peptidase